MVRMLFVCGEKELSDRTSSVSDCNIELEFQTVLSSIPGQDAHFLAGVCLLDSLSLSRIKFKHYLMTELQ